MSTNLQETEEYPANNDGHASTVDSSHNLVFASFLVVLLWGEAVRALDLVGSVGTVAGATAERWVDAGLRGYVVVRASDATAFQLYMRNKEHCWKAGFDYN